MKSNLLKSSLVAAAVFAGVSLAFAATFDPETGEGFVGKGEVQTVFGWNNNQLQSNANLLQFRGVLITETTWACTNTNNERIQQRERTTTTQDALSSIQRERNQITGFILTGYTGSPTTITEGPAVNSCPSGPWTLTEPAGDPVIVGGRVQVSNDGTNWHAL